MRFRVFNMFSIVVGAVASVAACSSLDDIDQKPALASVSGRIEVGADSPALTDGSALRVAIVWLWPDRNVVGEKVTSDIPVRATFPASFTMGLSEPPPAAAMLTKAKAQAAAPSERAPGFDFDYPKWDDATAFAAGRLVAYEDRNHDGKLNLLDDDALTPIDRILGASEDVMITYLEGPAPPELIVGGTAATPGYQLLVTGPCTDPTPKNPTPSCEAGFKPMSTVVTLPLEPSETLQRYMCRGQLGIDLELGLAGGPDQRTSVPVPEGAPLPSPGAPGLTCLDGGNSFVYEVCTPVSPSGVCRPKIEACWSMARDRLLDRIDPAYWPCDLGTSRPGGVLRDGG